MSKGDRNRARGRQQRSADDEGLWVRSDLASDGTYVVSVSAGRDSARMLTPADATAYAQAAITAAQRAEHDAAVFGLFTKRLRLPAEEAVAMIGRDLRPDRAPLDDAATAPLAFVPGVNAAGKPFVHVHLNGEPWAQLTPDALRLHAVAVLDAVVAVDLDTALHRYLVGQCGVEEYRVKAAINDLADYRVAG